jgi:hypothetical protein
MVVLTYFHENLVRDLNKRAEKILLNLKLVSMRDDWVIPDTKCLDIRSKMVSHVRNWLKRKNHAAR